MKFLFLIFLSIFFLIPPINAGTVNILFSDFQLTSQDIDIYYSNGTFLETVRSNGSISLNDTFDYQLVFRPQKMSLLDEPMIFFRMFTGDFMRVLFSLIILFTIYKLIQKVFR